jgi:hypothetical protein
VPKSRIRIVALSLFVTVPAACDRAAPEAAAAAAKTDVAAVEVKALDAAATPLREWFEANAGKPRFITLVSPT